MAKRAIARLSNPRRTSVSLVLVALVAGCGNDAPEASRSPARERPLIYTTFFPTTYFTMRIGGDLVDVVCPLPADGDPIFWQPSVEVVHAYQGADLIVQNGAGLEKWVNAVSLPQWRTVNTARAFEGEWLHYEHAFQHKHGDKGAHSHEGLDGHTWLDPVLAKMQAQEILKALQRLAPQHSDVLAKRFAALAKDLDALHGELRAFGSAPEGQYLYASHPAYNYVAKRYGWRMVNLDLDAAEMPSAEAFAAISAQLKKQPGRTILWEREPLSAIAARFEKELGLASVVFDPLENANPGTDYIAKMRENIARLKPAFAPR